jgi:hypothetical protein
MPWGFSACCPWGSVPHSCSRGPDCPDHRTSGCARAEIESVVMQHSLLCPAYVHNAVGTCAARIKTPTPYSPPPRYKYDLLSDLMDN